MRKYTATGFIDNFYFPCSVFIRGALGSEVDALTEVLER